MTLTTFVLLFLLTGSVIIPSKALLMNVLMLSAAFGLPSKIIFIKALGIGTALAAIIVTTLILGLLAPSLRALLG